MTSDSSVRHLSPWTFLMFSAGIPEATWVCFVHVLVNFTCCCFSFFNNQFIQVIVYIYHYGTDKIQWKDDKISLVWKSKWFFNVYQLKYVN